ncbi:MAG: tetratricopeptide repeat protein [Candidatus Aureabacteria bacterium]|nr:tetratricopeptide repeat protein [Candidatus Auribacterota bacterium]
MNFTAHLIILFSLSLEGFTITESDLNLAKKAYYDEFYQVVEQKLSHLHNENTLNDKLSQEGALLLAFSAYRQKNWKQAEKWLDKLLIQKNSFLNSFDVFLLKMNIFLGKSDYYLAEKTLNMIWKMDCPQSKKYTALELLIDSYTENKKYQLAESYLNDQIQHCENENEKSHFQLLLMECMLQQGKLKQAQNLLKLVELTVDLAPLLKEKANLLSGRLFLDEKDYLSGQKRFLSVYEEPKVTDTGKQEALFGLCLSYWNLKKYRQAQDLLQRYLRQFPFAKNWEVADLMLGQTHLQLNDYAGAEKLLLELTEKPVNNEIYFKSLYWLGEAYYRQKKMEQAISIYHKLILLKDEDMINELYGVYGLGWVYFESGNIREAFLRFKKALKMNLDHKFTLEAWLMTGNCLYLLKHYSEGLNLFRAFLKRYPLSERKDEALFKLGMIHQKLRHNEEAITSWKTLCEDCPHSHFIEEALWRSGRLLYEKGKYEEALSFFRKSVEQFPKGNFSDYARLETGNCHYNMGQYEEALNDYEKVLVSVKNRIIRQQAFYFMGWCYFLSKQEDKAVKLFTSFLKQYGSSELAPQVEFWLGEYEYNHENDAKSLEHFQNLIAQYPQSDLMDNSLYLAGKSSFRLGQYEQAISFLSRLIRNLPSSDLIPDAYFLTGESYDKLGEFENAIDSFIVFETAYEDSYLRRNAFEYLAELFQKTEEYKNASIYYEKANRLYLTESKKNNHALLIKQAKCLHLSGESEKALDVGLKVIYDECTEDIMAEAIFFCVERYEEKKEYAKAIPLLKKLLQEGKKVNKEDLRYRIRKLKFYLYRGKEGP